MQEAILKRQLINVKFREKFQKQGREHIKYAKGERENSQEKKAWMRAINHESRVSHMLPSFTLLPLIELPFLLPPQLYQKLTLIWTHTHSHPIDLLNFLSLSCSHSLNDDTIETNEIIMGTLSRADPHSHKYSNAQADMHIDEMCR